MAAALVVSAGAAVVQFSGGPYTFPGLALSLAALACEAAFTILAVPLLARLRPVGVSTYACGFAAAMLLAVGLGVDGRDAFRLPTTPEAAALGYLALMVTALAFVLWYSGLRSLGAERAGLFAGLVPVAVLLSSAAVGAATITFPRFVGAVTVGIGVAIGMRVNEEVGSVTTPPVSGDAVDDLAEHTAIPDAMREARMDYP